MSVGEIDQLADRLCARAEKIESLAARDLVADLLLAARTLRALLRAFNSADVITL
jgi:hypothetical protein